MSILILRPQSKCQSSAEAFARAGLDAVACGLIDTELDHQAVAGLPARIAGLPPAPLVIVTSTVAAQQCATKPALWPPDAQFFAVGHSSAELLQQAGLTARVPVEARSEGLLAMPELQRLNDRTVVIVKGFGGRELLADSLAKRGATIELWELYKRVVIQQPISTRQWHEQQIQCIIATSGEVIEAAFAYFSASWLAAKQWLVVSERTAQIARRSGVSRAHINICQNASDQALIECSRQLTGNGYGLLS